MFRNDVFDMQYRAIGEKMWTILALVFCAVYPAQTVVLHQETGVIHIHKKFSGPPPAESPLQPDDEEATKRAEAFIKELLPTLDTRIPKSVNSIILQELNAVFTLALYNFVVKGFRSATLDNLVIRMSDSRVDFNATIPFLSAGGTVFWNGIIDENNFAIVSNVSTFSDEIKIGGIIDIQKLQLPTQLNVLQITDADITIDIDDIMIEFKIVEELVLFKNTLVQFMNKPMDDIMKSVFRAAVRLANEHLAKVPAETIINYLVPPKTSTSNPLRRQSPNLRMRYPYQHGYN
ncbi:hypothetical protein PYW08_014125 [Mythimna loreyi]|uniref:Uncharacterized protein n=1 Tax=Mythimna loreyi TaxID=667449 RepID=A0ACC2R764_9NEOP|nr:hypothetical protein PYW08_014125 [Mythimna loreyi]